MTETEIIKLKNEALAIRDKIISAKSTMESVEKNIESYNRDLKELGVENGNAEEKIKEMTEEIEKIYEETSAKIASWKEKITEVESED